MGHYFLRAEKFGNAFAKTGACMAKIDAFFNLMFDQKASDLHLSTGNPPILRIHGELQRVDFPPLENDALKSTAAALKEHFVLQKIAEVEKIEIEDADIEAEIGVIAERTGESYRKVRARLEKDDLIEALATELLERKALDMVLDNATYEDYEFNPIEDREGEVSTAEASAAPAELAVPVIAETVVTGSYEPLRQ